MTSEERIAKLEQDFARAKWRNRWLLAAVVILAGACVRVGAFTPKPKTIRATEFIVEDENGKGRARLDADKDGAGLALLDENGKQRADLIVDKDESALTLCDENEKNRALLTVDKDRPGLALYDENGKVIWSAPR